MSDNPLLNLNPDDLAGMSLQNLESLEQVFSKGLIGKTAVVTGGATGLGFNVANRLCEAGARVVIASRNEERGAKAVNILKGKGYEVSFVRTDVRNVSDCYAAIDYAAKAYGKVDIAVAVAAGWDNYAFLDVPEEVYDRIMDTDCKGAYFTAQAAARHMVANQIKGKIVLISSAAHLGEGPSHLGFNTYYQAAKAGVVAMTKGIAGELKQYGIDVNCVAPGGMLTRGVFVEGTQAAAIYGAEYGKILQEHGSNSPLALNPDQVALVVYALCTPMSQFMCGETVNVNGGAMMNLQEKPFSFTVKGCIPGTGKKE